MPRLLARLVICLALATVAAPRTASATTMVELTRAEMTDRSDFVVRAMVASRESRWNGDHTQIVTLTHLRVATYLKGAGSTDLTLRQIGGTVDGLTSHVAGDPQLVVGQDVIAFLRVQPDVVTLTAMGQALFVVAQSPSAPPVAIRDLTGITFVRRVDGRLVPVETAPVPAVPLADLLRDLTARRGGAR